MAQTRNRAPRADAPELAPIDQAAAYLQMHPRTVRRMMAAGELTAYRIRRQIRVDMREVRALVKVIPPEQLSA